MEFFLISIKLLAIAGVVLGMFYVVRKIVMLWTGCTKEEATKRIQAFLSQKEVYHLASDQMFIIDIWNTVKDIIGEIRYDELCRLSRTAQLFQANYVSGLPYVEITVNYENENEKQRLENILEGLVLKYLTIHGLYKVVLSDWKENSYVKMPALMIRYAETEEQLKILNACLQEETAKITKKYQPLKDKKIRSVKYMIPLGYDFFSYRTKGIQIPLFAQLGHLIVVGGSGSGKSTALLYWLAQIKRNNIPVEVHIMDFKASHEFVGITDSYAEFEACYEKIVEFYDTFSTLEEGGDGTVKILLIDEIAGLLTHLGMSKEGKAKADEIRMIMSSILMLGRSRNCFLWLAMQRYTATIFPASSGAVDNFHIYVGMGRLSVDSRKSLFAGEHIEEEGELVFERSSGLVLIEGQPLQTLAIPDVAKKDLLQKLQMKK